MVRHPFLVRVMLVWVLAVSLSACGAMRPNARLLNQVPREAPAAYQVGWKDGCVSGMSMTGNMFYKTMYRHTIQSAKMKDLNYARGWAEANTYCAHYTMAVQWEGGVLPSVPAEHQTLLPESESVFETVVRWGPSTVFEWGNTGFGWEEGNAHLVRF